MILKRSVRIVKKIQVDRVWKFVSLERRGTRYVWDGRPGAYFLAKTRCFRPMSDPAWLRQGVCAPLNDRRSRTPDAPFQVVRRRRGYGEIPILLLRNDYLNR